MPFEKFKIGKKAKCLIQFGYNLFFPTYKLEPFEGYFNKDFLLLINILVNFFHEIAKNIPKKYFFKIFFQNVFSNCFIKMFFQNVFSSS
jgi:hypothetical protein